MYPLRAVIIAGDEAETTAIRRELTNLSVTVEFEFADVDQAAVQRPLLADAKCFFLVKVDSSKDIEEISRLTQLFIGKPVVALLNKDSDVSAVMHIQRAGAAQVLLFPLLPEEIRAALDAVARHFGVSSTKSRVIAVLGANEGCGSTSLAVNLGDAVAREHKKSCILVELSLRLGRLGYCFNIEPKITVADLLAGDHPLDVNSVSQALIQWADRFQMLAGPHRAVDRRSIVAARVLPLIGSVRQMADVVVLDLPYTFDELYFECLSVADQVVLVGRPNLPSILALKVISKAVAEKSLGAPRHFVINGFDSGEEEFTELQLCKSLDVERIWTIADDPKGFAAAESGCQTLHRASPRSRAWHGIAALCNELTGDDDAAVPRRSASWREWVADWFRGPAPTSAPAPSAVAEILRRPLESEASKAK